MIDMALMARMRAVFAGMLVLALGACSTPSWGPSWNQSSSVRGPADSLTVRRVMGGDPTAEPLRGEDARWLVRERPRATLGDPDQAMRDVPRYEPVPRPDIERGLRQEPTPLRGRRGSSSAPALPRVEAMPTTPPLRPEAPRFTSGTPRLEGQSVPIPGQSPGVVVGGTDRYQVLQQAGSTGTGLMIPQGNGTALIIGPDGRTTTVPMPR